MSPCFKTFTRVLLFHERLDPSFLANYKMSIRLWREQFNILAMSLFHLLPQVPLTSPDSPWSIFLPWRSWAIRRILVHRVIVSLILAPCRARGSTTAIRRILVISPESSLHARRAVLVFVRAKMCGHLPLVYSTECPLGKPQASSPQFSDLSKNWLNLCLGGRFPFSLGIMLAMGQCQLASWWTLALLGPRLPSIQNKLDRIISGKISESFLDLL